MFKTVGVLKQSGGMEDNRIFMPIESARDVLEDIGREKFDSIIVKAENPDLVDQISAEIETRLMLSRHVTERSKDFRVSSAKATQERLTDITQTFTIFLGAIAAVSLLVGAVGIANTMFTSVLMVVFLINSGLVGFVGGIIGIALGTAISLILPNIISGFGSGGELRTSVPLNLLIAALVLSVLIGMVAGAIPAYRASRLKPVDALRYE